MDGVPETIDVSVGDLCASTGMVTKRLSRGPGQDAIQNELNSIAEQNGELSVIGRSASGDVSILEGRFVRSETNRPVFVLNRATKDLNGDPLDGYTARRDLGYSCNIGEQEIVAVTRGNGQAGVLATSYAQAEARCPTLGPVTYTGIPSVTSASLQPDTPVTAVFVLDEGPEWAAGTVFFATETIDETGEVFGCRVSPSPYGTYSEPVAMTPASLERSAGRVVGYRAGSHTYGDALDLDESVFEHGDIEGCWDSVREAST